MSLVRESGEGGQLHGVGLGQRSGQGVQDEVAGAQGLEGLRPHRLQRVHLADEVVQEVASLGFCGRCQLHLGGRHLGGEHHGLLAAEDHHTSLVEQLAADVHDGILAVRGGPQAQNNKALFERVASESRPVIARFAEPHLHLRLIWREWTMEKESKRLR